MSVDCQECLWVSRVELHMAMSWISQGWYGSVWRYHYHFAVIFSHQVNRNEKCFKCFEIYFNINLICSDNKCPLWGSPKADSVCFLPFSYRGSSPRLLSNDSCITQCQINWQMFDLPFPFHSFLLDLIHVACRSGTCLHSSWPQLFLIRNPTVAAIFFFDFPCASEIIEQNNCWIQF